jgi:hypothetical protein
MTCKASAKNCDSASRFSLPPPEVGRKGRGGDEAKREPCLVRSPISNKQKHRTTIFFEHAWYADEAECTDVNWAESGGACAGWSAK